MKGHDNGMEDYVWTYNNGKMLLYPNKGLNRRTRAGESFWAAEETIFDPSALIGRPLARRDLHLADFNGDGACDVIW